MLDFHRRSLESFGQADLPLDRERGVAAARVAAEVGIELPPAVAEWYCVPEPSRLWDRYCGHDAVHNWPIFGRLNGSPQAVWSGRAVRDEVRGEWWELPAMFHDQRGWLTAPVLPLMSEIYSSWWWGVVLDGTADPRVALSYDEGETWDICCPSFSAHVYALFFDAAFSAPEDCRRDVVIEAEICRERRRLREEYRQEPTTRDVYRPETFTERFSREGQRFSFANFGLSPRRRSSWRLWAASPAGLADLVARLGRIVPALTRLETAKGQDDAIPF